MEKFDVVVLGSGPGGYVAAIRAAQLGGKVAIIEEEKLGGVCLNKGCIPSKALLKAAHSVHEISDFKAMGINIEVKSLDGSQAVRRSQEVAERISKGVGFLMNKNKIQTFYGRGVITSPQTLEIKSNSSDKKNLGPQQITFKNLIIATGAHYRTFPGLQHDGKRLIGAWEAVKMTELPQSVAIIGAGAIGMEFAYFWNAFGVDVHIFELQSRLLPLEDSECSREVERAYKKYKIKFSVGLESVQVSNAGKHAAVKVKEKGEEKTLQFDKCLIAVGMTGNIEDIGLEKVGIKTDKGFIVTNSHYQTNVPGIYAIGDVSGPPLLAHAASHEGVVAAEHIFGLHPHAIDKRNIPACTYCQPQVASVGYTEDELKKTGAKYKVGKLPFMANGKAVASNETDGFVKVLMGEHGEMLGAHIVGTHATELIHEYTLFRQMEGVDEEIFATVHPHPTLGEWLAEAVLAAQNRSINF